LNPTPRILIRSGGQEWQWRKDKYYFDPTLKAYHGDLLITDTIDDVVINLKDYLEHAPVYVGDLPGDLRTVE